MAIELGAIGDAPEAHNHSSRHSVRSRGEFNGSSWLQGMGQEARAGPWHPA